MSSHTPHPPGDTLRDFTATPRTLQLALMAALVGSLGAGAAFLLLRLIALFTNLAYYGRFSVAHANIPAHLPLWSIAIPVTGSLIIGLMARYGSDKIRGLRRNNSRRQSMSCKNSNRAPCPSHRSCRNLCCRLMSCLRSKWCWHSSGRARTRRRTSAQDTAP